MADRFQVSDVANALRAILAQLDEFSQSTAAIHLQQAIETLEAEEEDYGSEEPPSEQLRPPQAN